MAVAALAAAVMGVAKGGLTGLGMLAVPVMALVMSPVQAAGIMLPILIASDGVSVWTWWKSWDMRTFRLMIPGAVAGTALGWATARFVSDDAVRAIVGIIAIAFFARWLWQTVTRSHRIAPQHRGRAAFWGTVAGYTSFVSHAGGPPYQVYTMPLGQDPRTYTGTNVLFFAVVNLLKVIPYFLLGQFGAANLAASAALMPVAVVFTFVGAWIIRRMSAGVFYPVTYVLVGTVGAKLLWDALPALWG
ncbi:MAG: sulfite exporter TauE/SafE family protein [Rubellimicrobium sp.]|nr:sulfite exporter TauE/SafE family protein [Rubellimicrobium sp.]